MNFKIIKTKKGDLLLKRVLTDSNYDTCEHVTISFFDHSEAEGWGEYEERIKFDYESTAIDFIENFSEKSALKWIETIK